jgi:hypothetical protein
MKKKKHEKFEAFTVVEIQFKSRFSGLCHHVVLWLDTNVSKVHAASLAWTSENLYPATPLHGDTTQKNPTWMKEDTCLFSPHHKMSISSN